MSPHRSPKTAAENAEEGHLVRVKSDGPIGTVTLDRPGKHNAISDALYEQLCSAVLVHTEDSHIRVIVITGTGPSFSAGRDTTELGRNVEGGGLSHRATSQRLNRLIRGCPKPVIASLHGYVLGKAVEIAVATDFRVASADTKIGLPEINFGLITDNAGATGIALLAGPSRAKLMLMSGQPVDAATALAWGLVDRVVEADRLEAEVHAFATRLSERDPLALQMAKEAVDQLHEADIELGFRTEMLAQLALFAHRGYRLDRAVKP